MKTLCTLVGATLLAGCAGTTMQPQPFAARQDFGYPRIESLPLPQLAPRTVEATPVAPAAASVPSVANASQPPSINAPRTVAMEDVRTSPYDETKDPVMRALLANATQPVNEELRKSDGKLLLPPPAKLDIIDIRDVSGALHAEAMPPS